MVFKITQPLSTLASYLVVKKGNLYKMKLINFNYYFHRAVFKFDGNSLGVTATGNDFSEFKALFGNEDRGFGYIRIKVVQIKKTL